MGRSIQFSPVPSVDEAIDDFWNEWHFVEADIPKEFDEYIEQIEKWYGSELAERVSEEFEKRGFSNGN